MTNRKAASITLMLVTTLLVLPLPVSAQRSGQSVKVTVGKVERATDIKLASNAGRGAAVGGVAGLASASGKSSSKKARNALIGAGVGGAIAGKSQGDRSGRQYTVRTADGGLFEIISDQTEMQVGDCVIVEESGNKANVRRASASLCEPESKPAIAALEEEFIEEAEECIAAKQAVLEAETEEALDLAMRKAKILCND